MDKELGALFLKRLELVQHTATQAWWRNRSDHCGSDFHRIACRNCFAFEQCNRHEELNALISELRAAVG